MIFVLLIIFVLVFLCICIFYILWHALNVVIWNQFEFLMDFNKNIYKYFAVCFMGWQKQVFFLNLFYLRTSAMSLDFFLHIGDFISGLISAIYVYEIFRGILFWDMSGRGVLFLFIFKRCLIWLTIKFFFVWLMMNFWHCHYNRKLIIIFETSSFLWISEIITYM